MRPWQVQRGRVARIVAQARLRYKHPIAQSTGDRAGCLNPGSQADTLGFPFPLSWFLHAATRAPFFD